LESGIWYLLRPWLYRKTGDGLATRGTTPLRHPVTGGALIASYGGNPALNTGNEISCQLCWRLISYVHQGGRPTISSDTEGFSAFPCWPRSSLAGPLCNRC